MRTDEDIFIERVRRAVYQAYVPSTDKVDAVVQALRQYDQDKADNRKEQ